MSSRRLLDDAECLESHEMSPSYASFGSNVPEITINLLGTLDKDFYIGGWTLLES